MDLDNLNDHIKEENVLIVISIILILLILCIIYKLYKCCCK